MKQYEDKELLEKIQKYIGELSYTHEPENLYKPIEYVLGLGGKRIRPVLMLMAYNLYKDDVEKIYQQAAALETYHNFTLLHDDLMDKADMRRNRPTVHKKWDENTAILSGDAMLILSFKMMMESCPAEYISEVRFTENRRDTRWGKRRRRKSALRFRYKIGTCLPAPGRLS